ncbi:serine hydrolase [Aestuariivirga sp.]|uniref:serine hydrolase n=1 Tax=Aestuariivirga sp. TaxID=2650926 RepID=UPI0039E4C2C7
MTQRLIALLLSLAFGIAIVLTPAEAAGKFAALTVDARTGKILYDNDSNGLRHPASLTKMMTLYIIFEELKAKRITLQTPIRMSARAAGMAPSKMGIKPGGTLTVQQAIYSLVIKSANDVAAAVAENLGGSESAFAKRMTTTARRLGMTKTTYVNASGLPNPRQITTARDQATLGLRLMRDFPQYYPYFRATQFVFNGKVVKTHNRLLGRYNGTDGIKTGYINASGFNLVTSAKRGNKRLVGVVLGGKTGGARDRYMMTMLDSNFGKAKDGKTVAAKAGSGDGVIDPLKNLSATDVAQADADQDTQAMAQAASIAAQSGAAVDSGDDDEGNDQAQAPAQAATQTAATTPAAKPAQTKVVEAQMDDGALSIPEQDVQATQPAQSTIQKQQPAPGQKLPFQVKKLASQADVDDMSVASVPNNWAVEIGDFKTRSSANAVIAKLKAGDANQLAGKDQKTIQVKRNGATLYRLLVSGYDEASAKQSCARVARMGKDCSVLSPNG